MRPDHREPYAVEINAVPDLNGDGAIGRQGDRSFSTPETRRHGDDHDGRLSLPSSRGSSSTCGRGNKFADRFAAQARGHPAATGIGRFPSLPRRHEGGSR